MFVAKKSNCRAHLDRHTRGEVLSEMWRGLKDARRRQEGVLKQATMTSPGSRRLSAKRAAPLVTAIPFGFACRGRVCEIDYASPLGHSSGHPLKTSGRP